MARRDQLAGQLRQAGDKAAAAEIRSLRRPTTAAWAVNQLAATHPEQLSALVALGERLRRAHEAVLEEGNTAGVREVTAERRRLVAELADTGVRMLGKGGEAQREKISQTLDAAVADRNLAELVCAGRLTKELTAHWLRRPRVAVGRARAAATARRRSGARGGRGRPAAG